MTGFEVTVLINSVDKTANYLTGSFSQTATYYTREAEIELIDDSSYTLKNSLAQYQDVQIKLDGTLYFRGAIQDFKQAQSGNLTLYCIDYSYKLAQKPITLLSSEVQASEGNTYASSYVKYILDTYFNGVFSYDITATAISYTRDFKGVSVLSIIRELALAEDYLFYLEPQLAAIQKVYFEPETTNDLNIFLDDNDILDSNFPRVGSKIKNVIIVEGRAATATEDGIRRKYRDSASIILYGEREKTMIDPTITSYAQAEELATMELKRLAFPLVVGKIEVYENLSFAPSGIIYLTLAKEDWTEQAVLVLSVDNDLSSPVVYLKVAAITTDVGEIITEILDLQRQQESRYVDESQVLTVAETHEQIITIDFEIQLLKRAASGAKVGTATVGLHKVGSFPTATFTELRAAKDAKAVNDGITSFLKQIGQISPGNKLDGTYAYGAIGTSNQAAKLSDSALIAEIGRSQVEGGFPSSDGSETTWEFIITDGEVSQNSSIYEIGLFNASSAGTLFCRLVLDAPISKSAGEELKIVCTLKLTGDDLQAEQHLREILAGLEADYLSDADLEFTGGATVRLAMDSGYPKLGGGTSNSLRFRSTFDIPTDIAAGITLNQIKLYSEPTGGTVIIDPAIADLQTVSQEDILLEGKLTVVNVEL